MKRSILSQKRKKPVFEKQDIHKRNKLKNKSYRKAKGYTSPQRLKKRGKKVNVDMGYRNPKKVRGLHNKGKYVKVNNLRDLINVTKNCWVLVNSKIGLRKKEKIIKEIIKIKAKVLNFKQENFTKKIEKDLEKRKIERKKFLTEKSDKVKKIEKEETKKEKEKVKETKKDVSSLETFEGGKKKKPAKKKENKKESKTKTNEEKNKKLKKTDDKK